MGDDRGALDGEHLPLRLRRELLDVVPLPIPRDTVPVVQIEYEDQAREVFSYLRAFIALGEKSERALKITEEAIYVNSSDYTAWELRWQCLTALDKEELYDQEIKFLEDIAKRSQKNYQLWNHRTKVALKRGAEHAEAELEFTAAALELDAKNYHAWAHRQEVLQQFDVWDKELDYVDKLIQEDVRNNSAWNQRFYILSKGPQQVPLTAMLQREMEYVMPIILKVPHNESSWNYLRGVLSLSEDEDALANSPAVAGLCREVLDKTPSCPPAWTMLADIYTAQVKHFDRHKNGSKKKVAQKRAAVCFAQLKVADPLRCTYWEYCMKLLEAAQ